MSRKQALAWAGAAAATGMAALWVVVVPDKADATEGLQSLAIRHGHPLTWAALAVLGVLIAVDAPQWTRTAAGAVSLASYGAFLAALAL